MRKEGKMKRRRRGRKQREKIMLKEGEGSKEHLSI